MEKTKQIELYINQLQSGDREGLKGIYELCEKDVYTFALSLTKSIQLSHDIKQETFIKIMNSSHSFKGGNVMAWIFTITKHTAYNAMKKHKREVSSEVLAEMKTSQDFGEDNMILKVALKVLSKQERKVVLLHLVSGYKQKEVAEMLRLPLTTVKYYYRNSLIKMKKVLENDYGF